MRKLDKIKNWKPVKSTAKTSRWLRWIPFLGAWSSKNKEVKKTDEKFDQLMHSHSMRALYASTMEAAIAENGVQEKNIQDYLTTQFAQKAQPSAVLFIRSKGSQAVIGTNRGKKQPTLNELHETRKKELIAYYLRIRNIFSDKKTRISHIDESMNNYYKETIEYKSKL